MTPGSPSVPGHQRGAWRVIRPRRDTIDYDTALEFRSTLLAVIDGGVRYLAVDLSRVRLIDSTGLGAFVAALKKLDRKGEVRIFGASPHLKNFFTMMRMGEVLRAFDDEETAVTTAPSIRPVS